MPSLTGFTEDDLHTALPHIVQTLGPGELTSKSESTRLSSTFNWDASSCVRQAIWQVNVSLQIERSNYLVREVEILGRLVSGGRDNNSLHSIVAWVP